MNYLLCIKTTIWQEEELKRKSKNTLLLSQVFIQIKTEGVSYTFK